MAPGDDAGRAVLSRKIRHCPERVELNLEALGKLEEIEHPLVAMDRLCRRAGLNSYHLRQMNLESRGMPQRLFGKRQYERMHDQITTRLGASDQAAGSAREAPREIVAAQSR